MSKLLINADMGESFGPWVMGLDEHVMPHVDLANVACGFHASDPHVIRKTVRLAKQYGVKVGAHPSYPDLVGFGRRSIACSPDEVEDLVLYQVGALAGICQAEGTRVHYIKPHGALYNDMIRDLNLFEAVVKAVRDFDASLPLMTMATCDTSREENIASRYGVTLWFEAFADRAYDANGRLVSRSVPGAVHEDARTIVDQAVRIAKGEALTAIDGSEIVLAANTLCVHGDNNESIAAIQSIREAIKALP
ncbi:LamB/YcsF family protein [Marinobacter salinexigens]|uniref:5-oxoprolinase subunit A n=1 Tax=Marinobacter salinexigens TaxID=2919747 RepID=A0A5B0VIK2_9GAMM|nr:5-oxoprolinase subunit PxpA [Marinobacter salinexigens]KAA1174103.1 LamB/YcsF family protein [Marinobacter salinexigens]